MTLLRLLWTYKALAMLPAAAPVVWWLAMARLDVIDPSF